MLYTDRVKPDANLDIRRHIALLHLLKARWDLPDTLSIDCWVTSGNYRALVEWEPPYHLGREWTETLSNLCQVQALYKKDESLDIGYDKVANAKKAWFEAELSCCKANANIDKLVGLDDRLSRILYRAQRKTSEILGDAPQLSELRFKFGPGATTTVKRNMATPSVKLGEQPSCSGNMLPLIPYILREMPPYLKLHEVRTGLPDGGADIFVDVNVVDEVVQFVPKNAKTFRGISKNATLNTMCQLAIGEIIAKRLRKVGVDITDDSANKAAALEGSLTGEIATLDSTSASDTQSIGLASFLLSPDWFGLLSLTRHETALLDGQKIRLQKFSSMGNGYTFPLETLFFWVLTWATCVEAFKEGKTDRPARISVYGDDVTVDSIHAEDVMNTFEACGYIPNRNKSHWTGNFRESCGKDFHFGIDIRPYFVKNHLTYADLFVIHNFYVRGYDDEAAKLVRSFIPSPLILWGPDNFGDGHLVDRNWSDGRKSYGRKNGWSGWIFETWKLKGQKLKKPLPGDAILPLYQLYVGSEAGEIEDGFTHIGLTVDGQPRAEKLPGWFDPYRRSFAGVDWESIPFDLKIRDHRGFTPHERKGESEYPVKSLPGSRGVQKIRIYTLV